MDPTKDENCDVHYLASDLPQPLPTLKEIEEAGSTYKTYLNLHQVARIGENYITKKGQALAFEGWTMLYLRKMTSIALPTVYAILTDKKAERDIIVMEYIPGPSLDNWADLEASQKEDIAKQLAAHFSELRALPSLGVFGRALPPEYGNLKKDVLPDFMFRTVAGDEFGGPFDTVQQVGQALADVMRANSAAHAERAKLWESLIPEILKEGPPVFTHGDLQRKNIILRDDGKVFIIDWGLSGWFPECWEYCYTMYAAGEFESDWHAYIPKFLSKFPSEFCLTLVLRNVHHGSHM
ncbi:hypothetical protein INS49_010163 [Diaporthe citri]|uniref:uncharacterized protein n=1 Tax=Diaporthe citri TaxID=83186 RepID=UPI001C7FCB27|nr:uncharacterized protein INS49_010163 [Diaporthe citri]KAG6361934.1 hypothetical protein INS49_010163 [Diaporthe citri]